ncbi:MAG: VOC family protein [Chloroflexi bacterium]|nr:VOC family protein [Chloroflexota bacterium]
MDEMKPIWVEHSSTDPAKSREFYSKVFGWKVEVHPDPQYGGYGMAKSAAGDIAGMGRKQPGDQSPSSWMLYLATKDARATADKAKAAGGTVVAPPFAVGDQGTMAVI